MESFIGDLQLLLDRLGAADDSAVEPPTAPVRFLLLNCFVVRLGVSGVLVRGDHEYFNPLIEAGCSQ
eukprot:355085-Rhodomonas_salina.2